MREKIVMAVFLLIPALFMNAEVTIEQCVERATANYPAIRKYNLLAATKEIELSDINKSWQPRIGIYGQVTAQNIVPEFPEALSGVLHDMGQEMKGMGKIQYKLGAEISQTIWDGGASKARREVSRTQEAMQSAGLEVELYQIRQRVENLYFAILLTEVQTAQSQVTYRQLCDNLDKLRSMFRNGTAMQADVDMVEAQALTVNQNIVQSQSASESYRKALELFIGGSLENETLTMPDGTAPIDTAPARPELRLFDRKLEYNEARQRLTDSSLMPSIGMFAQGYYGYPGFNYFKSMMNRNLSLNLMAGVKVAWNIDSFYTKRNTSRKTAVTAAEIATDREVFMFNNRIQSASQIEIIKGLRNLMREDARIIALRTNVRMAAESQLANGVIDVTSLLTKISDENIAQLTSKYHEIMLIQEIYKLKYILDR